MKRNKDKRVRGRFVISILWKYFLFSAVLILLLICLFFAAVWNTGKFQGVPYMKELKKAFDGLSAEDYDTVDVERILGKGSYIQILDDAHKVIYSNDPDHAEEIYSAYELGYISSSDDFSLINVEKYAQTDGTEDQVIRVNSFSESGREIYNDIYIVDEQLNILYSNTHKEKRRLTQREFQFLTDRISSRLSLSKTVITGASGEAHTLLAYSPRNFRNTVRRTRRAYLAVGTVFLFLYTVVAFLFSLWIASRVKKPLRLLDKAMERISAGDSGIVLSYRGPKEFVEICENFNEMSLALETAKRENSRLEKQKQKMIADISHDLKTPITVIKGYSRAVADGIVAEGEQGKYLQTIYQRSSELADLIEEFHEYAKMEHPDSRMEMEPSDFSEFVREYFAEKYDEFSIGGYVLEADIDENKIMVNLDRKKFCRVLDNITSNFFKYCSPGSTFYCRVEVADGEAAAVLADNGKGIPDEIKNSVFDPFVVGEKSRTTGIGGSGLGLPLAKKITEAHGGRIFLENSDQMALSGTLQLTTVFVIRLPLAQK